MGIKYCKNSTIVEAWALIAGLPGPVDETDASAVVRKSRELVADLEQKRIVFGVHLASDPTAPFWNHQVTWQGGRYMARFGHRYLSVHFIRQNGQRYETFDETLRPTIRSWLDVYNDALGASAGNHIVDLVGFGYVNRFEFEAAEFDVSRYFKVDVGLDLGDRQGGLLGLDAGFRFLDEASKEVLTINVSAEAKGGGGEKVAVGTKVFAERRGEALGTFSDREALMGAIMAVKESAKEAFFGFATSETCDIMEAVHDAD